MGQQKSTTIRIAARDRNETRLLRVRLRDYLRLKTTAERAKCSMMDLIGFTLDAINYDVQQSPPPKEKPNEDEASTESSALNR